MNGQQRHGTTMSAGGAVSDEVAAALRSAGVAEVDFSTRRRAEYSSDASNYRLVPAAVVFPRHRDEAAAAAIEVCRELGVPLVSGGAGTSIAGNAVSSGVILDFSRHLNQVSAVAAVWLVILVSNAATTTSRWRSRRPRDCPTSALQL